MKADSSMGPLLIVAMVLNTKWCRINIRTRKVRGVCSVFYLVPPGAIPYALRASAVHGSNGTLINEYLSSCLCLVVGSCPCCMLWFQLGLRPLILFVNLALSINDGSHRGRVPVQSPLGRQNYFLCGAPIYTMVLYRWRKYQAGENGSY